MAGQRDKIRRLEAENERLREALSKIAFFARERDFLLYMNFVAEVTEQALEGSGG